MPAKWQPTANLVLLAVISAVLTVAAPRPARAAFLEFVEAQREGIDGVTGLAGVLALAVSADGRQVYAAGGNDDAVDVFQRDPATGALTLTQTLKDGVGNVDGLAFASSLALSPDGAHLYVAGTNDDAIAVFARDATTGALTFLEAQKNGFTGVEGLRHASAVVVSPDGSHVYVAGQLDDAIAVFRRNGITGWLTFIEVQRQGVDGVTGIAGPLGLAISPDGANVYVASGDVSAVGSFRRDKTTGHLSQVDVEQEGAAGDFGLRGIHGVTVSPDGSFVYGVGQADSAVVVFRRNKRTGALSFDDAVAQAVDDVDGLTGALRAAISPDGTNLYVASTHDNAIAAFDRNVGSGALSFLERQQGGPCDCLAFARAVAVSPDGKNVYAAGASSNAVNVFRVVGK